MAWEKQPPWEGEIHQGCLNCPPVREVAPMEMVIAVGFGTAIVTRDGRHVYSEDPNDLDGAWRTADAEKAAVADPDHDWRILMVAPLRDREYQRHEEGKWVLIRSGEGFA